VGFGRPSSQDEPLSLGQQGEQPRAAANDEPPASPAALPALGVALESEPGAERLALRLLALDVHDQRVVLAVEATTPGVVSAGESISGPSGYRLRRVLEDRAVLERAATPGTEARVLWVFPLTPGEPLSRVQEVFSQPPPGTVPIRPRLDVQPVTAENAKTICGSGEVVAVGTPCGSAPLPLAPASQEPH
jgi:hypothetical protein